MSRNQSNQASKIDRMERQIKKQNGELKDMAETLESRTQQLAKEKRENEANVNFIERMKIELEMVWQNLPSFKAVKLNRRLKAASIWMQTLIFDHLRAFDKVLFWVVYQ